MKHSIESWINVLCVINKKIKQELFLHFFYVHKENINTTNLNLLFSSDTLLFKIKTRHSVYTDINYQVFTFLNINAHMYAWCCFFEKIKRTFSIIRVKFDPLCLTFLKVFLVYKSGLFYFVLLKLYLQLIKVSKEFAFFFIFIKCKKRAPHWTGNFIKLLV